MEKVILESPYRRKRTEKEKEIDAYILSNSIFASIFPVEDENKFYAKRCLQDSLFRGEAPFASHLLYTQVLDENNYGERCLGLSAAFNWYLGADACVVYIDKGISEGMEMGMSVAMELKIPIEFRSLDKDFKVLEKRYEYG